MSLPDYTYSNLLTRLESSKISFSWTLCSLDWARTCVAWLAFWQWTSNQLATFHWHHSFWLETCSSPKIRRENPLTTPRSRWPSLTFAYQSHDLSNLARLSLTWLNTLMAIDSWQLLYTSMMALPIDYWPAQEYRFSHYFSSLFRRMAPGYKWSTSVADLREKLKIRLRKIWVNTNDAFGSRKSVHIYLPSLCTSLVNKCLDEKQSLTEMKNNNSRKKREKNHRYHGDSWNLKSIKQFNEQCFLDTNFCPMELQNN